MKTSRLFLVGASAMAVASLSAQNQPAPRPPGTTPTTPTPTPTTPTPTTPTPTTPTTPTPTTPTTPSEPGVLPPPGALPDPALGLGPLKKPTTSPENDAAFTEAVDAAGELEDTRSYVKGPIVTLEEALRITLARQPSIKLSQEDLEIARAGLQDAIGAFDTHLTANFEHSRTITPSPDGNIIGQKKARKALIDLYRGVRDFRKGKNDGKIELDDIDDQTGNVRGTNTVDISGLGGGATGDLLNRVSGSRVRGAVIDVGTLQQLQAQAALINSIHNTVETNALNDDLIAQITGVQTTNQQAIARLERDLQRAINRFSIQETSRSNNTKYDLGLVKTFRSGITVSPGISFDKSGLTNNLNGSVEVTIPLGQGFGGRMLRAFEDTAYYDMLASELFLRHEISNALLQTALAYWNCIAALENYVLLRQSEDISDSFVKLTNLRLESQEVAASEVSKARARSSAVLGQVIDAEFALLDARRQLAIAMGFEGEELCNPPFAAGSIPTEIALGDLTAGCAEMMAKALASRADRAANLQLVRSGKRLAEASWRDIKPRFDFFFNAGLASAHDGAELYELMSTYNDRWRGMSARGGFTFDWDIVNNPAKAAYLRNLATYNRSRITALDLDRQIVNNVLLSAAEIRKRKEQLAAVTDAARFSSEVLKAERQRYNDGEGSLLDTLQVEEQYTNDLVSVVTVKLQFISAVSRLRFESGTILDPLSGHTPHTATFSSASLTSVPDFQDLTVPPPLPTLESDERKRPLPLFQKFGRGNIAEVRAHEAAIKTNNWRKAMLDQPHLAPTAVTGAPVIMPAQGGKGVVTETVPAAYVAPPAGPVYVETAPSAPSRVVEAPVRVTAPPPPPPPQQPAPTPSSGSRPQPLFKRLFGN